MNLTINARDAMPNGGRLEIETQNILFDEEYVKLHPEVEPGSYVMLAVTDFGEGMGKDVLEHLFDPFFTTKDKGKGTGLGLATAHGIIKQHSGQVFVYSELGKGTTFKIYFPACEKSVVVPEKKKDIVLSHGEETILVVDDEQSIRKLIVDTLKPLGYKCIEASCGTDAIKLAKNTPKDIHLLLTDVIMPGMNGKELSRVIKANHPAIKIMFISGYTENAIASHTILDAGVNYLPKPLTPTLLVEKIRQVLNRNHRKT